MERTGGAIRSDHGGVSRCCLDGEMVRYTLVLPFGMRTSRAAVLIYAGSVAICVLLTI